MSTMVLDTNVVSYLMKGGPLAEAYRALVRGSTLAISFMTFAEMHERAYRAGWGAQKLTRLEALLGSYVVIPSSPDVSGAGQESERSVEVNRSPSTTLGSQQPRSPPPQTSSHITPSTLKASTASRL